MKHWKSLALGCVVALSAASRVGAQCATTDAIPFDTLRTIALRLHPEVADSAYRTSYAVVTLVFDSSCRVVHHSLGHRRGPQTLATRDVRLAQYRLTYGGTLALLRPTREEDPVVTRSPAPFDDGRPQVAWAFVARSQ